MSEENNSNIVGEELKIQQNKKKKKTQKINFRIRMDTPQEFEGMKKQLTLTWICVPPALIQSGVFYFLHDRYITGDIINTFFDFFFIFLVLYFATHLIISVIFGCYEQFNKILEKIGQVCVYGLYFCMGILLVMRGLYYYREIEQSAAGECKILSSKQLFNDNNDNYINNASDIYIKNFDNNNVVYESIDLESLKQEQYQQIKIQFQAYKNVQNNENNNVRIYEENQQFQLDSEVQFGSGCVSNNAQKTFFDVYFSGQLSPVNKYYIDDILKLPSWSCLTDQKFQKIMQKSQQNQGINCFFSVQKDFDGNDVKIVRFDQSIHVDTDLENLLPFYAITMILYGIQLFTISYIFEKIPPRIVYKLLVKGKVKYYVKTLDSYVTITSINMKKITAYQTKIEIAKYFQLNEKQVVFYRQNNYNNLQNKKKCQKRKKRRIAVYFVMPKERALLSVQSMTNSMQKFRKDIAYEIMKDFISDKIVDFNNKIVPVQNSKNAKKNINNAKLIDLNNNDVLFYKNNEYNQINNLNNNNNIIQQNDNNNNNNPLNIQFQHQHLNFIQQQQQQQQQNNILEINLIGNNNNNNNDNNQFYNQSLLRVNFQKISRILNNKEDLKWLEKEDDFFQVEEEEEVEEDQEYLFFNFDGDVIFGAIFQFGKALEYAECSSHSIEKRLKNDDLLLYI